MEFAEIRKRLMDMQDEKYRDFNAGLIPTHDRSRIIGVRTPELRRFAKELIDELLTDGSDVVQVFIENLPHEFFEEKQLHAFIISEIKDYELCISELEKFLPYVDNWATCDQLNPRVLGRNTDRLLEKLDEWLKSSDVYAVRFAIRMYMNYYLEERFQPEYMKKISEVTSDEYYINMMISWYFATALAKQYDAAVVYLEERRLPEWIHRKTIQKACESRRVSDERKAYLKGLR